MTERPPENLKDIMVACAQSAVDTHAGFWLPPGDLVAVDYAVINEVGRATTCLGPDVSYDFYMCNLRERPHHRYRTLGLARAALGGHDQATAELYKELTAEPAMVLSGGVFGQTRDFSALLSVVQVCAERGEDCGPWLWAATQSPAQQLVLREDFIRKAQGPYPKLARLATEESIGQVVGDESSMTPAAVIRSSRALLCLDGLSPEQGDILSRHLYAQIEAAGPEVDTLYEAVEGGIKLAERAGAEGAAVMTALEPSILRIARGLSEDDRRVRLSAWRWQTHKYFVEGGGASKVLKSVKAITAADYRHNLVIMDESEALARYQHSLLKMISSYACGYASVGRVPDAEYLIDAYDSLDRRCSLYQKVIGAIDTVDWLHQFREDSDGYVGHLLVCKKAALMGGQHLASAMDLIFETNIDPSDLPFGIEVDSNDLPLPWMGTFARFLIDQRTKIEETEAQYMAREAVMRMRMRGGSALDIYGLLKWLERSGNHDIFQMDHVILQQDRIINPLQRLRWEAELAADIMQYTA